MLNYIIIDDVILKVTKLDEMEIFQDFDVAHPVLVKFKGYVYILYIHIYNESFKLFNYRMNMFFFYTVGMNYMNLNTITPELWNV